MTSTKQFVWSEGGRREERDGSSNLTSRFFVRGQSIGGASYYYSKPDLPSICEMTDASGVIQAQYSFDAYGRATKVKGSLDADFQYAGYYFHQPSKLSLTVLRAYLPSFGRWINRDPIEEAGGINLYSYVINNPVGYIDPLGLAWGPNDWKNDALKHCIASCQLAKMFGNDIAQALGDAWEAEGNKKGQTSASSQMDLNNNAVGREGPRCENCGDYCRRKYDQGQLSGPLGPIGPPNGPSGQGNLMDTPAQGNPLSPPPPGGSLA